MVKPDVVAVGIYSLDYPLWRHEMAKYKELFAEVYNVLYNDNRNYNVSDFIKENSPQVTTIDIGQITDGKDWRDQSVNTALKWVSSEWILFIEQDFIPRDEFFYEDMLSLAEHYDVIGFADGTDWVNGVRLHPACLLVRRSFINMTSKDFGAHPDKGRDHFGTFTDELLGLNPRFLDIGKNFALVGRWKHYAGFTSNFFLLKEGKQPNYFPEEFKELVKLSLNSGAKLHPDFERLAREYIL